MLPYITVRDRGLLDGPPGRPKHDVGLWEFNLLKHKVLKVEWKAHVGINLGVFDKIRLVYVATVLFVVGGGWFRRVAAVAAFILITLEIARLLNLLPQPC